MHYSNELLREQFLEKRTISSFLNKEIPDELIKQLYELTSYGATAFNAQPGRFLFLKSFDAKNRIKPYLMEGNIEKVMNATLTVIVATDYSFYENLHETFPIADVKGLFSNNKELTEITAFRNSTLSGAYLIKAAHALGLDTGAMSGFDNIGLDQEFFQSTNIKSNFIINIGYGDYSKIQSRLPRLSFEQTSKII